MEQERTNPKGKILVIDDDKAMLAVVRRQLEAAGYAVVTSESALKMPSIVQKEKPDLVLLDVEMPALRGDQVVEMSKLFDFLRRTPILLHSGKPEEELAVLARNTGATGYMCKTSNPLQFVRQVGEWLERARPAKPAE